jgi:hypothetical protein
MHALRIHMRASTVGVTYCCTMKRNSPRKISSSDARRSSQRLRMRCERGKLTCAVARAGGGGMVGWVLGNADCVGKLAYSRGGPPPFGVPARLVHQRGRRQEPGHVAGRQVLGELKHRPRRVGVGRAALAGAQLVLFAGRARRRGGGRAGSAPRPGSRAPQQAARLRGFRGPGPRGARVAPAALRARGSQPVCGRPAGRRGSGRRTRASSRGRSS